MRIEWENYQLPDGRSLQRDEHYGFLKVTPRPTPEELSSFYASAYKNPCLLHDPEGRADLVTELFEKPGRVLDIGCGRGELLETFLRRGWDVLGLEPSNEYAATARERGVSVIQEQLHEALVPTLGQFDAVLLVHVLEHLPDPERFVKTIRQLLRPGGVFYCEVPNDFNRLQLAAVETAGLRPWWITLPDHLNYFSIESLASFIGAAGFEVIRRTTDFPVELFLLWGDVYVDQPDLGREMHQKRIRFEQAMRRAGEGKLLQQIYEHLGALGIGREAIVCARRTQ